VHERAHAAIERTGIQPDPLYVRCSLLAITTLAAALTAAPAAHAQSTGGTGYTPLEATSFSVTPGTIAPGATLTVRYRVATKAKRVRVRLDVLPAQGGKPQATKQLGRRPANRALTARWRPKIATAGDYVVRLRATMVGKRAHASATSPVQVQAAPVTATTGVFPVQGAYNFGGPDSRFGAVREGHSHQGQDIAAAAGTPIVAPRAGTVTWKAYQADGAGNYVVLHTDDGRDMVFMHMQTGSVVVARDQALAAGQQIGAVGATGHSDGPHLHFEIWLDGWYASKASHPIDPLPDLLAWAG
jgi:murein DD-endopeptidase MepM/ murein hydrolase activator NlpD